MKHYIDKDALAAEINERIKYNTLSYQKDKRPQFSKLGKIMEDEAILSVIETIEVKEVDLEKEYKDFIKSDNGRSMFETAKHFFELGIKARQ